MKNVSHRLALLFVEPTQIEEEQVDAYTEKMHEELKNPTSTGSVGMYGDFASGVHTLGVHTCICGAKSQAYDVKLPSGFWTNTLAEHYLRFHRREIQQTWPIEWDKVVRWMANDVSIPAEITSMTLKEMKARAKQQGIQGYCSLAKVQLQNYIQ